MIQFDQTLFLILLTTGILGINCGIIGTFLVLQKKSLFGDTITHATLPGLTGIFFLTLNKSPIILLASATGSAICASLIIDFLEKHTSLKQDTILGIVLASSFGLGTVFLSKIQTIPDAHQAGLTKYLLGNASTLLYQDLYLISIITFISCCCVLVWLQKYEIMLFDPEYAKGCKIFTHAISTTMLILTTLTIVIGLQTIGVILISALLIAPACAARQWSNRYEYVLLLAALFGMLSTTIGTLISCSMTHIPTGPTIVIVASCITLLSILFAPQGIALGWWRKKNIV